MCVFGFGLQRTARMPTMVSSHHGATAAVYVLPVHNYKLQLVPHAGDFISTAVEVAAAAVCYVQWVKYRAAATTKPAAVYNQPQVVYMYATRLSRDPINPSQASHRRNATTITNQVCMYSSSTCIILRVSPWRELSVAVVAAAAVAAAAPFADAFVTGDFLLLPFLPMFGITSATIERRRACSLLRWEQPVTFLLYLCVQQGLGVRRVRVLLCVCCLSHTKAHRGHR